MPANTNSSLESKSPPLVILPAAGFGRRVGSPPAKELFLGPEARPLIDWSLELSQSRGWPSHVVTREEKSELIHYLNENWKVAIQLVKPTREWPESPFKAKPFWAERNILILPDTRFEPPEILDDIAEALQSADLVFAHFQPEDDFQKWGVIAHDKEGRVWICDKPKSIPTGFTPQAWGIFGFKKQAGEFLLNNILDSCFDGKWKCLSPIKATLLPLNSFKDLTR